MWSYLKSTLVIKTTYESSPTYQTLNTVKATTSTNIWKNNTLKLAGNGISHNAPIEMMFQLANATKNVANLKHSSNNALTLLGNPLLARVMGDTSNPLLSQTSMKINLFPISSIEQSFTVTPKDQFNVYQLDLDSAALNRVSPYNVALSLTGLNTQEALKASKEDR